MKQKSIWLVLAVSIILSFLLYGYSMDGTFVRDDALYSNREDLHEASSLLRVFSEPYIPLNQSAGVYRPLVISSFATNFVFFGDSTVSFHIFNILLNGLVTFLVFLVIRALFRNNLLAFLSAIIFAFLPIHSEAVAFIKSRDELLATFFGLLAWLAFIRSTKGQSRAGPLWLSAALFGLCVLSKETLFALPALFLGVYAIQQKPSISKLIKLAIPFATVGGVYFFIRYLVLGKYAFGNDVSEFVVNPLQGADFLTQISTAFKLAFLMFTKTVIPWNLSISYNFDAISLVSNPFTSIQAIIGLVLLGGLVALVFLKKPRSRVISIAALIILVSYFMVSKLIFNSGELTAERWMYFPSIGAALLLAFLLNKIFARRAMVGVVCLALILVPYGFVTVHRNFVWLTRLTVGESAVASAPESALSHLALGDGYFSVKDYDRAIQAYEKARDIYPKSAATHFSIARVAYFKKDYVVAEQEIKQTVQLRRNGFYLYFYALILAAEEKYTESLSVLRGIDPGLRKDERFQFVMAVNLYKLGRTSEARQFWNWEKKASDEEKLQRLKEF